MGGLTQSKIMSNRYSKYTDLAAEAEQGRTRVTDTASAMQYIKDKREEDRRAEEAERDRVSQQLEEVSRQREAQREASEQARQQFEAESTALANQQRALEQTGAVESSGGTNKPYNPTSSASTTVEGAGSESDRRRKRNQLTAYLGI